MGIYVKQSSGVSALVYPLHQSGTSKITGTVVSSTQSASSWHDVLTAGTLSLSLRSGVYLVNFHIEFSSGIGSYGDNYKYGVTTRVFTTIGDSASTDHPTRVTTQCRESGIINSSDSTFVITVGSSNTDEATTSAQVVTFRPQIWSNASVLVTACNYSIILMNNRFNYTSASYT